MGIGGHLRIGALVREVVDSTLVTDAVETVRAVRVLAGSGMVDLTRPQDIAATLRVNRLNGPAAALVRKAVAEHPDATAMTDERGSLTYRELDQRSNAVAAGLRAMGIVSGASVGMLARDHRGLVTTVVAAGKAGLDLVMLNTGFGGAQLVDVARREKVSALLYDSEFDGLLAGLDDDLPRIITWLDDGDTAPAGARVLDDLIAESTPAAPVPDPTSPARITVLTSGTTGLPKGAPRAKVSPLGSAMLLDRLPIPRESSAVIATPMFHGTGFALWLVSAALGNNVVTMRRFDAEKTLTAIADNRAELLVAVPTMLSRMLDLGDDVIARYDLSSLKGIIVAGSSLTPELSDRVQDAFGEVLHNLYGSTEVAVASVATPAELRRAPGTAGRAPVTARIRLVDDGEAVTEPGRRGEVFVRCAAAFKGYTDGTTKSMHDGYMSTGDVGHFDDEGLLFIDGRADDMIVSGGENVYPQEVEHLLAAHRDVADVAVLGVPDPEYGQRLRAVVVLREGASLDVDGVRAYVKSQLARHKVPRDVVLVPDLPRNPTGKVVRKALLEMDV